MLKLLQNLVNLNGALFAKIKSIKTYDEAIALYNAKDYKAAFPLLQEAAGLNHLEAMSILGTAYLFGHGCHEDGSLAEHWLKAAVTGGFEDAKGVLGMAYATGKAGCRRDLALAMPLLQEAAESGDAQSMKMLAMIRRGEGMFAKSKRSGKAAFGPR